MKVAEQQGQNGRHAQHPWRPAVDVAIVLAGGIVWAASLIALLNQPLSSWVAVQRLFGSTEGWVAVLAALALVLWAGSSYLRRRSAESRARALQAKLELLELQHQRETLKGLAKA